MGRKLDPRPAHWLPRWAAAAARSPAAPGQAVHTLAAWALPAPWHAWLMQRVPHHLQAESGVRPKHEPVCNNCSRSDMPRRGGHMWQSFILTSSRPVYTCVHTYSSQVSTCPDVPAASLTVNTLTLMIKHVCLHYLPLASWALNAQSLHSAEAPRTPNEPHLGQAGTAQCCGCAWPGTEPPAQGEQS